MQISTKDWNRYINRLNAINSRAADMMREYIQKNGFDDTDAIIRMANAIATKYGEAAAAATCDIYEAIAEAQGVTVRPAEPARTPTMEEAENVIRSALRRAPSTVPDETGKLVKKTSTRTMRKNAARDNAMMALVPGGDGCAFCKMLASRGWESARSSKSFEAHLHKNCKCEYVVRFKDDLNVEGYDPDALYQEFMDLGGKDWNERVNLMRQKTYAEKKDKINAQKREAYAENRIRKANMGRPDETGSIRVFQKTVGARLFMSDIVDFETGMTYHISDRESIKNVQVFAGKGANEPYHKAYKYSNKIGGKPEDWKHMKGIALIENEYESGKAEIHWSEHDEYGAYDPFVKKWL